MGKSWYQLKVGDVVHLEGVVKSKSLTSNGIQNNPDRNGSVKFKILESAKWLNGTESVSFRMKVLEKEGDADGVARDDLLFGLGTRRRNIGCFPCSHQRWLSERYENWNCFRWEFWNHSDEMPCKCADQTPAITKTFMKTTSRRGVVTKHKVKKVNHDDERNAEDGWNVCEKPYDKVTVKGEIK